MLHFPLGFGILAYLNFHCNKLFWFILKKQSIESPPFILTSSQGKIAYLNILIWLIAAISAFPHCCSFTNWVAYSMIILLVDILFLIDSVFTNDKFCFSKESAMLSIQELSQYQVSFLIFTGSSFIAKVNIINSSFVVITLLNLLRCLLCLIYSFIPNVSMIVDGLRIPTPRALFLAYKICQENLELSPSLRSIVDL